MIAEVPSPSCCTCARHAKRGDRDPERIPGSEGPDDGSGAGPGDTPGQSPRDADDDSDDGKIRCPLCRWRPTRRDLWHCTVCDHDWNTFDTAAKCPKCGFQYTTTWCGKCGRSSPHVDWYEGGRPAH